MEERACRFSVMNTLSGMDMIISLGRRGEVAMMPVPSFSIAIDWIFGET